MRYSVKWRDDGDHHRADSRLATWGGRVTDTTPGLKWAPGKDIGSVINRIEQYGGVLTVDPKSSEFKTIERKST